MATIYGFLNKKGEVRYVGVTTRSVDDRRNELWRDAHNLRKRHSRTPLSKWLRSLTKKPETIVLEEVPDEDKWEAEARWISPLGNGHLLNVTSGGSGVPGLVHSKEARASISESMSSTPRTPKQRRKMAETRRKAWREGKYDHLKGTTQ